jgi:hypothetical protein
MGACSGKLVALSDQDDLWRKDRIAHAAAEFDRCPELDLLLSDARLVDRDGTPLGRTLFEALEVSGPDLARIDSPGSFPMLLKRHLVTGATVMLRSRLLGSALPFSPDWVQDEWLAIIAAATGRLDIVDQPLIDHRQHDSNLIGVVYPTLQRQEQRALKPQGDRKDSVADHFERFAGRMQSSAQPVHRLWWRSLATKLSSRPSSPTSTPRQRHIASIIAINRERRHATFASLGRLDILQNLVQPHGERLATKQA